MSEDNVERRLAAILAADVVGYSRLMEANEERTMAALKHHRREFFDPTITKHSGRIFKVMGDGFLVEFGSVVSATRCAVEIQAGMAARNDGVPQDQRIVFRIGVNLGDVMVDGADLNGDGVNVAARLEGLADLGGICLSANVYDQVRRRIEAEFDDLGLQTLKNIAEPVRVYRVRMQAGEPAPPAKGPQTKPAESVLSIAVLPFDNMSAVPEHCYIGDGIAENIITDLSRFRDIAVIARNSSFAYKGKPTRIQDIRRDLGVNYVLEGSVQKAGDRIRVTAQLIEGESGKHLWAERYDRRVDDIFDVMDEITQTIVGTLATTYGGRLRKSASEKASDAGPTSSSAFDHFVRGMQELNKFTQESIPASIELFKEAIRQNPRYAKAHAKLAWGHLMMLSFGWADDEAATLKLAQDAADRAIWADESEAWSHWALAGCALMELKHDLMIDRMLRAIELNPSDADVLTDMGMFCSYAGKAEEGLAYALKGMRINPHHPDYYADQLGQIYFDAGKYAEAIRTFEGIRSLKTPSMLVYLAASHSALGQVIAARDVAAELLGMEPQSTSAYWTERIPYKLETDRAHMAENLRLAGLPE